MARFVGGSQDGKVRKDTMGAAYFVVPIPRPQAMTAERAVELLSMHWEDRPPPTVARELYKRSVERDDDGRIIGLVYTYERTDNP